MSIQTFQSPVSLFNALLEHIPLHEHQAYSLRLQNNQAVIDVVPDRFEAQEAVSAADTPESRRQEMLNWIKSIATPAGLSDYDLSRESMYSPDR